MTQTATTVRIHDTGTTLVVSIDHGQGQEFAGSYPTFAGAQVPAARVAGRAEAQAKAAARVAELVARGAVFVP